MKFFVIWTALTCGNFIYQAFGGRNWATARERSFFQGVAIGVVAAF